MTRRGTRTVRDLTGKRLVIGRVHWETFLAEGLNMDLFQLSKPLPLMPE